MKFLDLFSGIGGFRLGMEQARHECVGYVEIDKFARNSYESIHKTEGEWSAYDISTIDYREFPGSDCWCFDSPVRTSPLEIPEEKDLTENDPLCSLQSLRGFAKSKNGIPTGYLETYSLKMLKIFYQLMVDGISSLPSVNWMKSGTMQNGKFSIQEDGSLKTEAEYSLSDILEEEIPEKYFQFLRKFQIE